MSSNNNNNNSRNPYSFPDFSLRRLLLQGARAARGSPQLGTRLCDIERGSNGAKIEKAAAAIPSTSASSGSAAGMSPSSLNKVTFYISIFSDVLEILIKSVSEPFRSHPMRLRNTHCVRRSADRRHHVC